MAWTQADLDALETAIKTGVRKVTYRDGRTTEFRDLAEMLTTRTLMLQSLDSTKIRKSVILMERVR